MKQKHKNSILIGTFLLVVIMAYRFAFSRTLDLRSEYNTIKTKSVAFENMPFQLATLKQKEKYYDSLLVDYQLEGSSIQNNLLKTIKNHADTTNLKVVGFLEPHQIEHNHLQIKSYRFTLEGNYNAILTLIHQLEQQTKFGEIITLNFKKKKNFKTGIYSLQAEVILKSFG